MNAWATSDGMRMQAPTADRFAAFKAWLLDRNVKLLPTVGSYEVIRFVVDDQVMAFQKRAKRSAWNSINGAINVYQTFLVHQAGPTARPQLDNLISMEQLLTSIRKGQAPPAGKFCKDCQWHRWDRDARERIVHLCACPALLNLVTGEHSSAQSNRNSETLCGKGARHFVAKAAA